MVICSTWDLGSGTLPTRMSRQVSMRRLVSESSMGFCALHELIQGQVVFDVLGEALAPLCWHCLEICHAKGRIDVQLGEALVLDDIAQAIVGDIGIEVIFECDDSIGVLRKFLGR